MRLVEVDVIPVKKRTVRKNKLYTLLDKFISMNVKIAKIEFSGDDYLNYSSAYTCLTSSADYGGFPIKVVRRDEDIYLVRKDM